MNASAVLDRRDSVFDPTRGWFYSTSLQWGLRSLGSDFDYLRTMIRGSYYQPIGPVVLASNARWGNLAAARWHSAAHRLRPLLQGRRHSDRARLQAGRAFGVRRVWRPARRNTTRRVQRGDPISCLPDCERRALRRCRQHIRRNAPASHSPISRSGLGSASASRHPWRPVRIDLGYPVPGGTGLGSPRWHVSIGQMFWGCSGRLSVNTVCPCQAATASRIDMPVPVSTSRSKEKPAFSNSAAYSSRVRCFPPIRTNMLISMTFAQS